MGNVINCFVQFCSLGSNLFFLIKYIFEPNDVHMQCVFCRCKYYEIQK